MTDEEAELLRAVEMVARDVMAMAANHRVSGRASYWTEEIEMALTAPLGALSAYRAQPQEAEAEGETVDVRAVVTMTPDGKEWTVMGSNAWSDDDAERVIRDYDPRNERRVAIITAIVPLPVIPTISASITGNIDP